MSVEINADTIMYTSMVYCVTRMQGEIVLTSLPDNGTVKSLWKIANRTIIMRRKTSASICLSVSYKSGVCISLSKDVNTEKKKSIIWLAVLCG